MAMNLYTDQGNINAFKLLIANQLKSGHLDIKLCKSEDRIVNHLSQPRLPILELPNGCHIFSPNAGTRYIYNEDDGDLVTVLDEWLEWEATQLQPVVHVLCVQHPQAVKILPELRAYFCKLLDHLEQTTRNNPSGLVGSDVTVADIVVWCSLYPVYCENSPLSELVAKYTNLQKWFEKFHSLPEVPKALACVNAGRSYDGIKASLHSWSLSALPGVRRGPQTAQSAGNIPQSNVAASNVEIDSSITLPSVTPEEVTNAQAAWNAGRDVLPNLLEGSHPVLPVKGKRNILITSALPYVNNVPHLGNIIGCVLSADVFARFCRLRNLNTLYICGTDEYGTATETKAMEEGVTPQEICDKYNKLHSEIYQWFNIGFDHFGRTTTQQQTDIAQDIFWKLEKNGYILRDSIEQLLCEKCNRFLADRFVEGVCPFCSYEDARGDQCDKCGKLINAVELRQPRCKQCKSSPVVKTSQHLFMDLPKLEPKLTTHLNSNFERGIWTSNCKIISKSWLRDGLKPRCISRDLKWGTPVPLEGYTDKVFYVWYDAPIGYISITANYTDQWRQWWLNPEQVELFHFMAKDNVPFHSVIFPCTLLGTGENWTMVNHLSATEYLNYEDGKFSKSRGVGVFGSDAMETDIPADVWRFYLLFLRPESQDSAFCWDDFMLKNNSELLNNLGNFINRALMFVNNSFGACIPTLDLLPEDMELVALITRELRIYIDNLTHIKLRDGLRNILTISRYGNQYMQAHKPWVKVKGSPDDKRRAGTIVGLAANIACLLSVLLQPYMPAVSKTIQTQLDAPDCCNIIHDVFVPQLPAGHHIGKPSPLFQKIEPCTIKALKDRFAGRGASPMNSAPSGGSGSSAEELAALEQAITDQGDVVRHLKTDKAEKRLIDEEVGKLLDLKKQLAAMKGTGNTPAAGGGKNKGKPKNNKQGQKQAGAGSGSTPAVTNNVATPADPAAVGRLTKEVADQGEEVRWVKAEKADKAVVDSAIAKLLDLKRQLAVAQGLDPEALVGGGKKKGKKK